MKSFLLGLLLTLSSSCFVLAENLPTYATLPEKLEFLNIDNQKMEVGKLKGTPFILNFFFASCPKVCPKLNKELEIVAQKTGVKVVSVTIDPERDTPESLKKYMEKFSFPKDAWTLLTGKRADIKALADAAELGLPDDPNVHTTRVLLIDSSLTVRGYFQGSTASEKIDEIAEMVKQLR